MNLCFIYTNHKIYKDSILSVPKFLYNLITEIRNKNPEWKIGLIAPEGSKINSVNVFEFKKTGILFFFNRLLKRIFNKIGLYYNDSKIYRNIIKKGLAQIGRNNVYFCVKYTDILNLKKVLPDCEVIQFNCSIFGIFENKNSRENFYNALMMSSEFVIGSLNVYKHIREEYGIKDDKIVVEEIPASVDYLEEISDNVKNCDKTALRKKFEINDDELVLLHIGGDNPIKGKKLILDELRNNIQTNRKVCLISVGNQSANKYNLNNNIRVIELKSLSKEEFINILLVSNIGLTPTLVIEPGPGVTLQMQYAKLMVLGSGTGGNLDYINDGVNGFLVKNPFDSIEWKNKLNILINEFEINYKKIEKNLIPQNLYKPGIKNQFEKWNKIFLKYKSKSIK